MNDPALDPIIAALVNGANPHGEPRPGHCATCGQAIDNHDQAAHERAVKARGETQ